MSEQYNNYNNYDEENQYQDEPNALVKTTGYSESNSNSNFKVVVRIRPPLDREYQNGKFTSTVKLTNNNKQITIYEYYYMKMGSNFNPAVNKEDDPSTYTMHTFSFDRIYSPESSQEDVYDCTAKHSVESILEGYNSTILAYGQTGTGKTYTMEGFKFNINDPQRGIIPRSMEDIFKFIENSKNSQTTFMVRASYQQIYMEVISDLLRPERTNLVIREDKRKGLFVDGLSEWAVRNPNEIYTLIRKGAQSRATAYTKANDVSSRSHAVFIITVEQLKPIIDENGEVYVDPESGEEPKQVRVGKLNLVDLAGSERLKITGATGKRQEECQKINQSQSCLSNVICRLVESKHQTHIPYRDSKLTRLLEDSQGGNCKTTMMAMISPAYIAYNESISTQKFANRAKNIKNTPKINEDIDSKGMIQRYELELKKLRVELADRNKSSVDKNKVIQLENEKKQAELDKEDAMQQLQERNNEWLKEREDRKNLEEKIQLLESKIVKGGKNLIGRNTLGASNENLEDSTYDFEYQKRFVELEKERLQLEEDRAQVDQYKQLQLKQRDIMIALTTRLNERDETIIQLQEELDAYDRIHYETDEMLQIKNIRVEQLEEICKTNNLNIPRLDDIKSSKNKGDRRTIGAKDQPEDPNLYNKQDNFIEDDNMLESINETEELRQICEDQKNEIARLHSTLAGKTETRDYNISDFNNLQNEFQTKINAISQKYTEENNIIKEQLNISEENNSKLLKIVQSKDDGQDMKPSQVKQIKGKIDLVIETLSQQNDPQKLHSVAKELLCLQKLIKDIANNRNNPTDDRHPQSVKSTTGNQSTQNTHPQSSTSSSKKTPIPGNSMQGHYMNMQNNVNSYQPSVLHEHNGSQQQVNTQNYPTNFGKGFSLSKYQNTTFAPSLIPGGNNHGEQKNSKYSKY